jgi:plastocyanin
LNRTLGLRTLGPIIALMLTGLPGVSAADSAPSASVHLKNFAYQPTPLVVHAGDSVTFVNDDDEAHTVTSSDKTTFDSEGLDSGKSWQHTFEKPGTYTYFCELHPYMKGSIVVEAAKS